MSVGDESVSYFPGEDGRTVGLEADDVPHNVAGRHARLAAADRSRSERARLVETTENLAHAAVRHLLIDDHDHVHRAPCTVHALIYVGIMHSGRVWSALYRYNGRLTGGGSGRQQFTLPG